DTELIPSALILIQLNLHLVESAARYILCCRANASDRARQSEPLAKSVLLRYGETALRVGLSNCRLAAQNTQNRRIIPGVSVRVRMVDRVGAFKRGCYFVDRPVDLSEDPKHPRHESQH